MSLRIRITTQYKSISAKSTSKRLSEGGVLCFDLTHILTILMKKKSKALFAGFAGASVAGNSVEDRIFHEFDNIFGNLCDDPRTLAKVFDKASSSKTFKNILKNKLHEIYKNPATVCREVLDKSDYLELQGVHLSLIQQLVALLGLQSTHDVETIVTHQHFVDHKDEIVAVVDLLFKSMGLRDNTKRHVKATTKQQGEITRLAKTVGRELAEFGGLKFKGIRKQKTKDGVVTETWDQKLSMPKADDVQDILRLLGVLSSPSV